MAKSRTSLRDERRELTRRALIKWSIATGAALGVSRSKVFEILERTAGKGVAFAASELPFTKVFDIEWGTGSLSWMTLLWPFPDIARARNPKFSWDSTIMPQDVLGTHRPLVRGPNTPWQTLPPEKQMTVFIAGGNETHKELAQSTTLIGGSNVLAVNIALQAALPAVLPAISVGSYRGAMGPPLGDPTATSVSTADNMVDLFNSAASRATGLLVNAGDAELYAAHYQAFIQLNRAASRSTQRAAYTTASGAAKFLGTNLRTQLEVTPADLARYGIDGNTPASVAQLGRAMITSVKAMKMGLTNLVQVRAFNDDPHEAFSGKDYMTMPQQLKAIFDGFMGDLQTAIDDNTGQPLADNIVIINKGDTFKDPVNRSGWQDNTPNGSNAVWVYGAGHLYSGFFGNIGVTGTTSVAQGVGPDGKLTAGYDPASTAKQALASILYAVAKRDDRAIQRFVGGTTVSGIFGPAKNM
jgi:hypothetical protein